MRVSLLVAAVAGWTVVALAILVVIGGDVNTPGCANKVNVTTDCRAAIDLANDAILRTQAIRLVVVLGGGYAAILLLARRLGD